MTDNRVAVVVAILSQDWRREFSVERMAEAIVAALDQRALVTKWEGVRQDIIEQAERLWIPNDDLLAYLNTLPGALLTIADLKAKLNERWPYNQGDPDLQADCVRVFKREQRAGTAFGAILDAISSEVTLPAYMRYMEENYIAKQKQRKELALSGKDFGPIIMKCGFDSNDNYMRHAGQLFRIHRNAPNQWAAFHVDNLNDSGTPTEPHIFQSVGHARDVIKGPLKRKRKERT